MTELETLDFPVVSSGVSRWRGCHALRAIFAKVSNCYAY
jgi:hypothetical protein